MLPTTYAEGKAMRKSLIALRVQREAAILAEERYNGLRLKDLDPQQLADVMTDAKAEVLS